MLYSTKQKIMILFGLEFFFKCPTIAHGTDPTRLTQELQPEQLLTSVTLLKKHWILMKLFLNLLRKLNFLRMLKTLRNQSVQSHISIYTLAEESDEATNLVDSAQMKQKKWLQSEAVFLKRMTSIKNISEL